MGELVIDEDPARSTLALTVTAPDGRAEVGDVRISAALTYADAAGEWYFTGSARSPRPAPVALHVRYLGVYRRAHRAMASLRISAELPGTDADPASISTARSTSVRPSRRADEAARTCRSPPGTRDHPGRARGGAHR